MLWTKGLLRPCGDNGIPGFAPGEAGGAGFGWGLASWRAFRALASWQVSGLLALGMLHGEDAHDDGMVAHLGLA